MNNDPETFDAGYSPEIAAVLELAEETFNLAALGPNRMTLRNPRTMPPGLGTVVMTLDGKVTIYRVDLFDGISAEHRDQPYRMVRVPEAVIA